MASSTRERQGSHLGRKRGQRELTSCCPWWRVRPRENQQRQLLPVVEGVDVWAREQRGASELLVEATAGQFQGLKWLPPMRPSTAVVKRTPHARVACWLEAKMKTPATVQSVDGDDSWAAAAVVEGAAAGFG
jgi:hypothetical protein